MKATSKSSNRKLVAVITANNQLYVRRFCEPSSIAIGTDGKGYLSGSSLESHAEARGSTPVYQGDVVELQF